MAQKSSDSRTLIIVAFITGIFGVVSACITGFFALKASQSKQDTLATNTVLAQQVTSGNSTQASLAQTVDAPTVTPLSTQTPYPTFTSVPQPTKTPFPSATSTLEVLLPFEDTFDLRPRPEWETVLGTWRVVDGHLTAEKEGAGRQMIVVGDDNWRNYTITVEIAVSCGGSVQIITRATNDGYIEFSYDGLDFRWELVRGGNEETIAEVARNCYDYRLTEAHNYKVSVNDDIFTAYLDGQQLLQVQDSTYDHGQVGLAYTSYNLIWFDNFKVTSP